MVVSATFSPSKSSQEPPRLPVSIILPRLLTLLRPAVFYAAKYALMCFEKNQRTEVA